MSVTVIGQSDENKLLELERWNTEFNDYTPNIINVQLIPVEK